MCCSLRVSANEKSFIEAALQEGLRVDGRRLLDSRRPLITFLGNDGTVEVQQGNTRILAVVSAELGVPFPDHPNEGSLAVFMELSPMADFEPGRSREVAVELGRVIERGLRESRAVDTESLCIVTGEMVWALRLDLHVLDNGGNLFDAANTAALAALLSFQIPDYTFGGADGQEVLIHPADVQDPHPLILHHWPIAVSFGLFCEGKLQVVDPNLKEEAIMDGRITLTLNAQGEICSIQKAGGIGLGTKEIASCLQIARTNASILTDIIKRVMEVQKDSMIRNFRQPWNNLYATNSTTDDEIPHWNQKEHILTTLLADENAYVEIGERKIKSEMLKSDFRDELICDVSEEEDELDVLLREEFHSEKLINHSSAGSFRKRQLTQSTGASSCSIDIEAMEEFSSVAAVLKGYAASQAKKSDYGTKILAKESNDISETLRRVSISEIQGLPQSLTPFYDRMLELSTDEKQPNVVKLNSFNAVLPQESSSEVTRANISSRTKPLSLLDAVKRKPKK